MTNMFCKTRYKTRDLEIIEKTYRQTMEVAYSLLYLYEIDISNAFERESYFEFMACYFPEEKLS